jgi:hypothetical protein
MWTASVCNFERISYSKQMSNRRKFDQSCHPGANPTIASYNANVVNFYNVTGSLARFENKNIIFYF